MDIIVFQDLYVFSEKNVFHLTTTASVGMFFLVFNSLLHTSDMKSHSDGCVFMSDGLLHTSNLHPKWVCFHV